MVLSPAGTDWAQAVPGGSEPPGGERLADKMGNLLHSRRVQMYRFQDKVVLVHCPMQWGGGGPRWTCASLVSREGVLCRTGAPAPLPRHRRPLHPLEHPAGEVYQYFQHPATWTGCEANFYALN